MSEVAKREVAELVVPALRWNARAARYECEGGTLEDVLALGVGGFCLYGGTADAARTLTADLRARSTVPLLIAADVERGAGQQFAGLTTLPPAAELGALDDAESVRRAAALTAREARSIGVSWAFAPVVDLAIEPENPVIGSRAFGREPARVAALARVWIEACQAERVLACAKHFPGHGRTCTDSHDTLPEVTASRELLLHTDLVPFKAAIEAQVASIMTAHVSYPALDSGRAPATLSRRMLLHLLRHELGFRGLIVTDALDMEGVRTLEGDIGAPVQALNAGCDVLLNPTNVADTLAALGAALEVGQLSAEHVRQSVERRREWAAWAEAKTAS
jgi:beta-glucosidase-like glycosyl hydrolase